LKDSVRLGVGSFGLEFMKRFFYRIRVVMNVENTGNVETAPSKIGLEVYDITKKTLLESREDKSLKKVKPFSVGEIVGDFPTKLPPGQYWGKVRVYKENEIVNFYEIAFSVEKPGVLGAGARSLGAGPWLLLAGLILISVLVVVLLIKIRFWRYIFFMLLLPTKPVGKGVKTAAKTANRNFWRWVVQQAEKHKNHE
jgi:hypothetical protein